MTKRWDEYKSLIISLYKEQHKPLHEVQRLMEEQHGFQASVRAYRSRFDRWRVHKYNCRGRGDSASNGSGGGSPRTDDSHCSPKREEPDSPRTAVTPPSTPQNDQRTPYAGDQARRQQLNLQPVAIMSPDHRYLPESAGGSGGGGCLVPPSPGGAESITSDSTISRTSSVSFPYNSDSSGLVPSNHHHRHSFSASPTEHQYTHYDLYRHPSFPQPYQGGHQYHPHLEGPAATGVLAPPQGLPIQHNQDDGVYGWPPASLQAPSYHLPSDAIKAARD